MTANRLVLAGITAAVTAAVTAVYTELPATPVRGALGAPRSAATCVPAGCGGVTATPAAPPQWVGVPLTPGCARSADPDACHQVTITGTGVDCDPTGCVLAPGEDGGWELQLELQAVAGMYADEPPPPPSPTPAP